jgi:small subunit ribosomal protein S6
MRRYEVVFVLAPTLTEEEVEAQIATYSEVAAELGAQVIDIDKWGKKRFAFPVKKHPDGFFTVFTVESDSDAPFNELERRFRVSDSVIRFLTVRVDQELKRAAKFEKKRETRRKARRPAPRPRADKVKTKTEESAASVKGEGDEEA